MVDFMPLQNYYKDTTKLLHLENIQNKNYCYRFCI